MALKDLSPSGLRDFVKSLGWESLPDGIVDRLYVLHHADMPRRQIVIPMDQDAPDYAEACELALSKLADLQGMTLADLIQLAAISRDDSIYYRVTSSGAVDDGLPLSFAASLLLGAEQILLASACTVLRPQTHHPRLHRAEATQLAGHARFGHTERGSFVVRVSCPVDAMETPSLPDLTHTKESFVRRTMLTARNGVRQLVKAIEEDTLSRFVDSQRAAASPIVSSNLCEALTRLHNDDVRNNIDMSFRWATTVALPQDATAGETITIRSDYFGRIDDVRQELRAVERDRDDVFIGTVEHLNGEFSIEGNRAGEVVVALLLREGEIIKARVLLDQEQYARAVTAHLDDRALVRIAGRLRPGRQPRTMTDVTSFVLIGPGLG
ncbi:hypothetical protein SBC1_69090 (plasmid) [Caballeronia sp. SBC1]|uniref:hypothetical protein n=1 Tax=unclassified Caballeronia TaxID=2646786 RepID=UPI0013E133EA|nr:MULTISPECIES: hypothetical protein [unclassified Caballeronia]QIE28807.1 hypothetical protein SBC2_68830 [Caballeronia sp. SBC2]QIN66862.1 hypothetical protein SBC1_69090 [Caballeronia sp. SBC1]